MRLSPLSLLFPALALLAACRAEPPRKPIEEMSPAEAEAAVEIVQRACRARGIAISSRDFDDCVKEEAIRRGYAR